MSFNALCAKSVVATLPHLPDQPRVVELGNQGFSVADKVLSQLAADVRASGREEAADRVSALMDVAIDARKPMTEHFYRALGFHDYAAIDVNHRYGSMVMDLNRDLGAEYDFHQTFDLVTNFGTAEHIFDQRRVFENIHNLTNEGGVMLHVMPFVNWINHGFYNFHPVLYADLAAANGYRIVKLAVADRAGFEASVDLDRRPAAAAATGAPSIPGWVPDSPKAVRVYRGAKRIAARPPATAPGISLSEAVAQVVPSASAPDDPLARAVEAVMTHERGYTGSDYPVLGNVLLVTALQKQRAAPFTVPLAGKYLEEIESDALRADYSGQASNGADADR